MFGLLSPKWCILVGATGAHICVYTYHQNIKLMLVVMNSSSNYRQIMKLCVYDVEKYNCMMEHCDNCPNLSVLKSFWENKLLKIIETDETIQFSQCVSTDRSQLVKEESKFDDFFEDLVGKFGKLTKHHYTFQRSRLSFSNSSKKTYSSGGVLLC